MSEKTQYWLRIFLNVFVLILFLGIFSFGAWQAGQGLQDFFLGKTIQQQVFALDQEILLAKLPDVPKIISRDWLIPEPEISSEAAICVEVNESGQEKILFKKNNDQKLSIASLTKLMTALVVLENKDKNKDYDLNKVTIVSQEAINQPGEQCSMIAGEDISVKNLLYIMLVESSNDAAYALAEVRGIEQFVGLMNFKAMELGLSGTNFADVTGLSPNNYSTVDDLVRLTKYILSNYPKIFEISSKNNEWLYNSQGQRYCLLTNTNELLGKIPDMVGGKTGETPEAKGCLILVMKNPEDQNYLIYVLLGSDDRFKEMEQFINWVNQVYQW